MYWIRLPREALESTFMQTLKTALAAALSNLIRLSLLSVEGSAR